MIIHNFFNAIKPFDPSSLSGAHTTVYNKCDIFRINEVNFHVAKM